jgi:hypothetical protein
MQDKYLLVDHGAKPNANALNVLINDVVEKIENLKEGDTFAVAFMRGRDASTDPQDFIARSDLRINYEIKKTWTAH